jgi:hypothetical protein
MLVSLAHFSMSEMALVWLAPRLALDQLPDDGWQGVLFFITLKGPMAYLDTLPPHLEAMHPWMFAQSVLLGIFLYAVAEGGLMARWHTLRGWLPRLIVGMVTSLMLFFTATLLLSLFSLFGMIGSKTYVLESAQFPTLPQRVTWLAHFIAVPGPVLDTDYRLLHRASGIGPDECDYRIAVKVPPSDVPKWLSLNHFALVPASPDQMPSDTNAPWPTDPAWRHTSRPEYYTGADGTYAIVYRRDGVLFLYLRRM